jgi:hypothetical protein
MALTLMLAALPPASGPAQQQAWLYLRVGVIAA